MSEALAWLPWSHRVLEGPLDVGIEQRGVVIHPRA